MRSNRLQLFVGFGMLALVGASAAGCNDSDGGGTGATGGTGGSSATTGGSGGSGGTGGSSATTGGAGAQTSSTSTGDTTSGGPDCGPGAMLCGDTCRTTDSDPENCGSCGSVCTNGEACDGGKCVLECFGGSSKCGSECVDLDSDPANCGQCGTACDADQQVCAAGQCVSACGEGGQLKCGGTCVDTMTSADNCGKCGNACSGTDKCVEGACTAQLPPKAVYTMTNDPAGNKILSFGRAADGSLSPAGQFTATGGLGTGAGLGNQHGLIFDSAQNLFFVVNAGDDSISMLSLEIDGSLKLLSNVKSGGVRPISITVSGSLVYVVNAGNAANGAAANISGFKIASQALVPIAGSSKPLSAANPNPAQIQLSPDGKVIVVTEKGTNLIDTYTVSGDLATGPFTKASAGLTPFGFDFSANQQVIVSEAVGGMPNLSSTSSYAIGNDGLLTTVSGAVGTTRTAACWLVVAGAHAYVANAQTNDITGFDVADNGMLTLLNADGVTGKTTMGATDEDVTDGNDFLYVVNGGAHVFSVFQINADGSLTKKPDFAGLPSTASGIVAR